MEKIYLEILDKFSVKYRNTYVLYSMDCTEDLILAKEKHLKPKNVLNSFSRYLPNTFSYCSVACE